MTEFRAPPPPPALDLEEDDSTEQEAQPSQPTGSLNPKMIAVAIGLLVIGILMGIMIAGSDGQSSTQSNNQSSRGLTNIIANPSITEQLKMCGLASETAPCILYIMNHSRYDKIAQDFFADAAKLSQRNTYTVEIENAAYAKTKIPPSFFVQMKIPALR